MEKQFKPVPDVECLKYHGTPEKPDIKIFVSHRIDQDSETIDNPLYIPVRCGAVYDDREGITMLGDDTGDNISEKRMSYCELTVQYWAWKNVKADYYGFCTSQKYLAFGSEADERNKQRKKKETLGLVGTTDIAEAITAFGVDGKKARDRIEGKDVIALKDFDVKELHFNSINEWMRNDIYHFSGNIITNLLKIIQYRFPRILPAANLYLSSSKMQTCPIFIATKEVFNEFCEFQFTTLEMLSQRIDMRYAGKEKREVFSLLGTHLWGIYLCYLKKKKRKVQYLQGVYCESVQGFSPVEPAFTDNNIPIVFSSSNSFAPYLGVALKSLLEHTSSENNYDIIVLEKSIHADEKERLADICRGDNVSLRFLNVNTLVANINFFVPTKDLSEETYYTILVPWILSKYEKAVVLDCDIIINHDIADLYHIDLNGCYIGAVKEIVYLGFLNNPQLNDNNSLTDYTEIKLGLKNPYDYFNAGVLLMNLSRFRQDYSMQYLLGEITTNKYSIVEQDLLNSVCAGEVLFLDYTWNFMSCLTTPEILNEAVAPSDTTIPNLRLAPEDEIEKYKDASKDPHIYHYLTRFKPWKYPYLKYAEIWWRVARTTVYYERFIYQLACSSTGKSYDTQIQIDPRTGARKLADKLLPKGTKRREFAKKILPKGSLRWRFCKQIYYIFKPQYRPQKGEKESNNTNEA